MNSQKVTPTIPYRTVVNMYVLINQTYRDRAWSAINDDDAVMMWWDDGSIDLNLASKGVIGTMRWWEYGNLVRPCVEILKYIITTTTWLRHTHYILVIDIYTGY
jgi:hypothetical protein